MDNLTMLGTGLTVLASKDVLGKLLGPTADYLGQGLKNWTEVAARNLNDIFARTIRILGKRIDQDGGVPPRVLVAILQQGQTCDDPVMAEYFAGVLASSRSGSRRDDRGAALISLLSRLSMYQVRSHYVFYHIFKRMYDGSGRTVPALLTPIRMVSNRGGRAVGSGFGTTMESHIQEDVYVGAMGYDEKERSESDSLASHAILGLDRENLIGPYFRLRGTADGEPVTSTNPAGVVVQPSRSGVELFLWVHGYSDVGIDEFLNPAVSFQLEPSVIIGSGFAPAMS